LRTVDVARRVGCSVQHLRDLEREGVLPPTERTPSGYRCWRQVHVDSAVAYRELAQGVGPAPAKVLLQALHRQAPAAFLAQLDDAHATLARERRDLRLARQAVAAIAAEPLTAPRPSDAMTISELADALGTTPASLRHWEAQGLIAAVRAGGGRVRTYSPIQVRDVRVIHQLRTAGYPIPHLRAVLQWLSDPRHPGDPLDAALNVRDTQLTNRSHALLRAAAALRDALAAKHLSGEAAEHQEDKP
jgi:DNA-binding transcriptional MerR regulator